MAIKNILFFVGLALIMEGVLSGCYHVCPNNSNFQFGMWSSTANSEKKTVNNIYCIECLIELSCSTELVPRAVPPSLFEVNNDNWIEWSEVWSEIIRVISKSNERIHKHDFRRKLHDPKSNCRFKFNSQICQTMACLSFIFLQCNWLV